jgi:hypothetical protein
VWPPNIPLPAFAGATVPAECRGSAFGHLTVNLTVVDVAGAAQAATSFNVHDPSAVSAAGEVALLVPAPATWPPGTATGGWTVVAAVRVVGAEFAMPLIASAWATAAIPLPPPPASPSVWPPIILAYNASTSELAW